MRLSLKMAKNTLLEVSLIYSVFDNSTISYLAISILEDGKQTQSVCQSFLVFKFLARLITFAQSKNRR